MNYYEQIKGLLISNELYKKVKDYSNKLIIELKNKKYSYRNLMNMRKFYLLFRNIKVNALRSQLSWSHYRELLPLKNMNEIIYYNNLAINNNLSYRDLKIKIKLNEYERIPIEAKNKLINQAKTIGIIICKQDNKYVIKYCSDKRIITREYKLV